MPPICSRSRTLERALGVCGRSAFGLALALLSACSVQNGVVGAQTVSVSKPDAGAPDAALPDAALVPTFQTDFDANDGQWSPQNTISGSTTNFGVTFAGAADPSTAELRFPGHPEYAATDKIGPSFATNITLNQRFGFGTYLTRLQFGTCSPSEDTVGALLGYFNDHQDENGNGITDDVEIDMQVLCGTPHRVYMTVFTDDSDQGDVFRKVSRVVDFSTGDVYDTPSPQKDAYTKTDTESALLHPEWPVAGAFYEMGFEWHTASLRFFIVLNGAEVTLWTLTDPARIPQLKVSFIYNMWHPDTHWYPSTAIAAYPANDVVMHVDWLKFYAE